jgi:arsenate reductase-like glutaredoxin family protein
MRVKEDKIQEAKDELLNRFLDTIKELAKDDKFWIIKRAADFDNSLLGRPVGFADDDVTVGYKFPNADMK